MKELVREKWNKLTPEERAKWAGKYFNKELTKYNWEDLEEHVQTHLIILLC